MYVYMYLHTCMDLFVHVCTADVHINMYTCVYACTRTFVCTHTTVVSIQCLCVYSFTITVGEEINRWIDKYVCTYVDIYVIT